MVDDALRLENLQAGGRRQVGVKLEELSPPDEGLAHLVDGQAVRVGLPHQRLVEVVVDLPFRHHLLVVREGLLRRADVDGDAVQRAAAETYLAARIRSEVGLHDVALDGIRNLARQAYDVLAFLDDLLGNLQHIGDFLEYTVDLRVEVLVVVDDAQVRMFRPCLDDLLVQLAGKLQPLRALGVVGRRIELLGPVGGADEVEDRIVTGTELFGRCADGGRYLLPHLRLHVGGDVHRAAVADDNRRCLDCLRHACEPVFQVELCFQRRLLTFVEEGVVVRKVIHAGLAEERRHLRNDEHLVAET